MKLRKAGEKDFEELIKLEIQSGFCSKKECEKIVNELLNDKEENVFVSVIGNKIIGYISLRKNGEIGFLAVDKYNRKKGIANLLIKKIISVAKREKIKKLFLEVRNENISAIRLYLKNGFQIVSLKKSSGKIKIRMERELRSLNESFKYYIN